MGNYIIKHHGIDGQKWGVMHGPPYPLYRQENEGYKKGQTKLPNSKIGKKTSVKTKETDKSEKNTKKTYNKEEIASAFKSAMDSYKRQTTESDDDIELIYDMLNENNADSDDVFEKIESELDKIGKQRSNSAKAAVDKLKPYCEQIKNDLSDSKEYKDASEKITTANELQQKVHELYVEGDKTLQPLYEYLRNKHGYSKLYAENAVDSFRIGANPELDKYPNGATTFFSTIHDAIFGGYRTQKGVASYNNLVKAEKKYKGADVSEVFTKEDYKKLIKIEKQFNKAHDQALKAWESASKSTLNLLKQVGKTYLGDKNIFEKEVSIDIGLTKRLTDVLMDNKLSNLPIERKYEHQSKLKDMIE